MSTKVFIILHPFDAVYDPNLIKTISTRNDSNDDLTSIIVVVMLVGDGQVHVGGQRG